MWPHKTSHLEKEVGKPGFVRLVKPDPRIEATFEKGLQEVRKADLVCAQQKKRQMQRTARYLD